MHLPIDERPWAFYPCEERNDLWAFQVFKRLEEHTGIVRALWDYNIAPKDLSVPAECIAVRILHRLQSALCTTHEGNEHQPDPQQIRDVTTTHLHEDAAGYQPSESAFH